MFSTIVTICSSLLATEPCLKGVDTQGPYKTEQECIARGQFIARGSMPELYKRQIPPPWNITIECVKSEDT